MQYCNEEGYSSLLIALDTHGTVCAAPKSGLRNDGFSSLNLFYITHEKRRKMEILKDIEQTIFIFLSIEDLK